jgi:hypothetical protein
MGWDSAVIQQDLAPGIRTGEQQYITVLFSLKITVKFKSECHAHITQISYRENKQRLYVRSYVSVMFSSPYPHSNAFGGRGDPSPGVLHPMPAHPTLLDLITLIIFNEKYNLTRYVAIWAPCKKWEMRFLRWWMCRFIVLIMETVSTSTISANFYQSTRHNVPTKRLSWRRENLKSHWLYL